MLIARTRRHRYSCTRADGALLLGMALKMKKTVLAIVLIGGAAVGWMKLRDTKLDFGEMFGGRIEAIGPRSELVIPITATGEIRPKQRIEIKPEASGTVASILCQPGATVVKGDVIVKLDPENEQRLVKRSENEVARAKATLEQQKLKLKERETTALKQIDAQIASVTAQLAEAKFDLEKSKGLRGEGRESEQAMIRVQSRYDQLIAQRDKLSADRAQAEIGIELAAKDVVLAQNAYDSAETNLGDARERLSETTIRSPIDGMVTSIPKGVGEVVQSGMTTVTGGTVVAVVADISEIVIRAEVSDADIGAVLWLASSEARPGGVELEQELRDAGVQMDVDLTQTHTKGAPVKILVDAFPDEEFVGRIARIYPEPKSAQSIITYLIDINVISPNAKKLAYVLGYQVEIEFTAQSVTDAILVPHDAIRRGPTGDLGVFIARKSPQTGEESPHFVPCRFGLDNGLYAELVEGEGIDEGVRVYTKLPPSFERDKQDDDD